MLTVQPDSRAFGAQVESVIKGQWRDLCTGWGGAAQPHPGKRTIFDVGFRWCGSLVGVDIKTKDLGMERYSDGGICSVGNLLRSLLIPDLRLLITEIGYATATTTVDVRYVRTCPLHCLPPDIYRIENLGTGQVRLDTTVDQSWSRIGWDRSVLQFLEPFCNKCIEHYRRVANDAGERRAAMDTFVRSGYKDLRLK